MNQPHTHALSAPPLVWSDYVFLALLIINLVTVLLLGRDIFIQGDKLEQARKNGELVMSKNNFKKIADKMANPRNAVAGIINKKKPFFSMIDGLSCNTGR